MLINHIIKLIVARIGSLSWFRYALWFFWDALCKKFVWIAVWRWERLWFLNKLLFELFLMFQVLLMLDAVEKFHRFLLCFVQIKFEEHLLSIISESLSILLGRSQVNSAIIFDHCAARILSWGLDLKLIVRLWPGHLAWLLSYNILLTRFDNWWLGRSSVWQCRWLNHRLSFNITF